jgi:hypothetical protein
MHKIDSAGATIDNKFTEGNSGTGTPATVLDAAWLNAVQEEMISVLAAGAITPAKGTWTQLRDAINYMLNMQSGTMQNKTLASPIISFPTINNGTINNVTLNAPALAGNARGNGIVPLGAIIAMGSVAAWALPAAGAVKDGYALCNGQAFSALGAGNFDANFAGNMPNLTDSRFLMGSTAAGSTGGANSLTLASGNIPTLFNSAVSVTGTTNIGHSHSLGTTSVALASGATGGESAHVHATSNDSSYAAVKGAGVAVGGSNYGIASLTLSTTGPGSNHTHTVSGTTNIDHSHTLGTTNVALASGTTATITVGNASPTALENRPLYFSVVYLMRVK